MKRIVSIIIALVFLINTTFAYTVKINVKGVDVVVTGEVGNTIEIEAKLPEIVGWNIKSGNVTITDNTFVMPEGDVEIEAIIEEEPEKYTLTVETPSVTRIEEKEEGQSVTVSMELEGAYRFINWTATGIELTEEEKVSTSITFTMPSNAVTLEANYAYGNEDTSGANEPQLDTTGLLTPVNWNGVEWVETDEANWVYNYNSVAENVSNGTVEGTVDGEWANAKTAEGQQWSTLSALSFVK